MEKKNNPYCEVDRKVMEGYSELEAQIEVAKKRKEYLDKFGYFIDCVISEKGEKIFLLNCHTHVLIKSRKHIESQVLLPDCGGTQETQKMGMSIIHRCVDKIDAREEIKEDILYNDILGGGYNVKFLKFNIDRKEVLRILLPDENNLLPNDKRCNPMYKYQLNKYGDLK